MMSNIAVDLHQIISPPSCPSQRLSWLSWHCSHELAALEVVVLYATPRSVIRCVARPPWLLHVHSNSFPLSLPLAAPFYSRRQNTICCCPEDDEVDKNAPTCEQLSGKCPKSTKHKFTEKSVLSPLISKIDVNIITASKSFTRQSRACPPES